MKDSIFEFNNITKRFFGVPALQDVSLQLKKGHVLGIIGENGAGKSTLMNIMGGILSPEEGFMMLAGEPYKPMDPRESSGMGIEFIHQELNLFPNLNVAENIYINRFPYVKKIPFISKLELKEKTQKLLRELGMDIDAGTLVENLSPGERQLVEIAKALSTNANIIMFDEPTTSLTAKETKKLFLIISKLKEEGKSIIYISHILEDVITLTDDLVILRDGKVVDTGETIDFPIDRMISLMVGRDINQLYPEKENVIKSNNLLTISELTQPGMVRDISFQIKEGEVLGIFGLMGSGRTELSRMIFGLDHYTQGTVKIDGVVLKKLNPFQSIEQGLSFVTEDRREEGLLMDLPIVDNLGLVALPSFSSSIIKAINVKKLRKESKITSELLKLKAVDINSQLVKSLSGGNQQKVVIGKWLLNKPKILIMDEPTRGIDIGAKFEIYTIIHKLAKEGSGILVVSSEAEELIGICDRIIVMSRGEIISTFEKQEFDQEKIIRAAFRQETADKNNQGELKNEDA